MIYAQVKFNQNQRARAKYNRSKKTWAKKKVQPYVIAEPEEEAAAEEGPGPQVDECVRRLSETWMIETSAAPMPQDIVEAAYGFCNSAYNTEFEDQDSKKTELEQKFKPIAESQLAEAKKAFAGEKEMHPANQQMYDAVKLQVAAFEEGEEEEIVYYCKDPPYYKGWQTVLDLTGQCVRGGGSLNVSISQIN